jgi:L-2-hydroxycarboxylate dehydrogenase (NAD+)
MIPENVALDAEGNPTIDPEAALKGSILPFGAHKGYALAFMIELLAGPLVKAAFGKQVKGTANPEEMCTKGDLLIAINPSMFGDLEHFKEEVDEFVAEVKNSGNVFIPGDMEVRNFKKYMAEGINIDEKLSAQLKAIAEDLSLDYDELIN